MGFSRDVKLGMSWKLQAPQGVPLERELDVKNSHLVTGHAGSGHTLITYQCCRSGGCCDSRFHCHYGCMMDHGVYGIRKCIYIYHFITPDSEIKQPAVHGQWEILFIPFLGPVRPGVLKNHRLEWSFQIWGCFMADRLVEPPPGLDWSFARGWTTSPCPGLDPAPMAPST